jgi:N-acetylglucosaminyldiphosphoundecaprenol N-acetyl-beta-D-mannosaminyltransferase
MTDLLQSHASAIAGQAQAAAMLRLIQNLRRVDDIGGELELLAQLTSVKGPTVVSFVNAHAFNLASRNADFRDVLLGADVILRDGIGLEIAQKMFGNAPGLNMNGSDFIPKVIEAFHGRTAAVFGTRDPHLSNAIAEIEAEGVHVVASLDGFQPADDYVRLARRHRPDVILLAMGMPRQEQVADRLAKTLGYPVVIINGGAIVDIIGGKVERAPQIFRALKAEWLYRLAREPRRLARRYLFGNAEFLTRVALLRLTWRERDFSSMAS